MTSVTGSGRQPRHVAQVLDPGMDADAVLARVGNTPLVPLDVLSRGLGSAVFVKLESENHGGSIKDRTALRWSGWRSGAESCNRAGPSWKAPPETPEWACPDRGADRPSGGGYR
jgi:hypothetical protein